MGDESDSGSEIGFAMNLLGGPDAPTITGDAKLDDESNNADDIAGGGDGDTPDATTPHLDARGRLRTPVNRENATRAWLQRLQQRSGGGGGDGGDGDGGIFVDPRITLKRFAGGKGLGLIATADVREGEVLISVPLSRAITFPRCCRRATFRCAGDACARADCAVPTALAVALCAARADATYFGGDGDADGEDTGEDTADDDGRRHLADYLRSLPDCGDLGVCDDDDGGGTGPGDDGDPDAARIGAAFSYLRGVVGARAGASRPFAHRAFGRRAFAWAARRVFARGFQFGPAGDARHTALLPVIDLMNHAGAGRTVAVTRGGGGGFVARAVARVGAGGDLTLDYGKEREKWERARWEPAAPSDEDVRRRRPSRCCLQ